MFKQRCILSQKICYRGVTSEEEFNVFSKNLFSRCFPLKRSILDVFSEVCGCGELYIYMKSALAVFPLKRSILDVFSKGLITSYNYKEVCSRCVSSGEEVYLMYLRKA